MNTIRKTLDVDHPIRIYLFGDEHIGDVHSDGPLIAQRVRECQSDPYGYAILVGDICNTATCNSVSDTYSETMSPMRQVQTAVKVFEDISDRILCMVSGNHEERTYKESGIDISYFIAKELGVPYGRESVLLFLRFGKTSKQRPIAYSIYVRHGSGGGRKVGGKANVLQSNTQIVDADIYIAGHTHQPIIFKEDFFRTSWQNSSVEKVTHTFVNLGSALDYGGYGERFGFAPGTKLNPVIHLDNREKYVTVTL